MSTPWQALRTWARMVQFSHSVFALPFALSGAVLAAANHGIGARQVGWIVVAMFGARNAPLGFHRLVDHSLDAGTPPTAGPAPPPGGPLPSARRKGAACGPAHRRVCPPAPSRPLVTSRGAEVGSCHLKLRAHHADRHPANR